MKIALSPLSSAVVLVVAMLRIPFASAATVEIELPGALDKQAVSYKCLDGSPLAVEYFNLPDTSLAVLPVSGSPRVFVSVLSASGAKYVSGAHVWWTRGNRGDLYDESKPGIQATVCRVSR